MTSAGKLVNGSRVGQVGPIDSSGQVLSKITQPLSHVLDRSDPSTHVDRSEISTRPGQNDKLSDFPR